MPIRVVLADDHYLVREGVQRLLESVTDVEVAAVCNDLGSLLDAVDAERPDVVVTDIRMPPGNVDEGIQAAARFRDTHPEHPIVLCDARYKESVKGAVLSLIELLMSKSRRRQSDSRRLLS